VTVTVRHLGDPGTTVVRGVDTVAGLTHLCRSLQGDVGFDDPVVILDVRRAPDVAASCQPALRDTMSAMRQHQRWLALVSPVVGDGAKAEPPVFATMAEAIAAGQRYFRVIHGATPRLLELRSVGAVVVTAAAVASDAACAVLRVVRQVGDAVVSWREP
jgi:hypothetical protein